MSAYTWQPHTQRPAQGRSNGNRFSAFGELSAGERVCAPVTRGNSKALLRGVFLSVIGLGCVWMFAGDRLTFAGVQHAAASAMSLIVPSDMPEPVEPAFVAPAALSALDPMPERIVPEAPAAPPVITNSLPEDTQAPPETTAALSEGEDETTASASPERLPPPTADPEDPYETRALAVGLHPGLSRVLLTQLSDTDYRNAGIAIRKALAETPDDKTLIWPRQRKPELALFQVKFVPGAAPTCRRYVVTVAKDGWSTTALPMEKCGSEIVASKSR